MAETLCRHFSGYKPCSKNPICSAMCPSRDIPTLRIAIVHLEAIGAVLRSTALLAPLKRKYPNSHLTWITQAPSHHLLKNLEWIDQIFTTEPLDILQAQGLDFDLVFCIDKSLKACALSASLRADRYFGFRHEARTGAIVPATSSANELWDLGLSDQKKFFENKKTETQLVTEALELPYFRDEYLVSLSGGEDTEAHRRRALWGRTGRAAHYSSTITSATTASSTITPTLRPIVGINTGCSHHLPYKKLSIEAHRKLIVMLDAMNVSIVLLGGPEDTERNRAIASGLDIISSPTTAGVRDGLISVAACDVIITGDSLGMHMAIALKKWTVAWFGPTCAHEIDLFDRGVKVLSAAPCGPCWKRSCEKPTMCYDLVPLEQMVEGVRRGLEWHTTNVKLTSSIKQPSGETSSSQSL